MQPLILLAIVAVGAVALGSGFLFPTFNVNVQNVGVGDADLASPIAGTGIVDVDLDVTALDVGDHYNNQVTDCSWHVGTDDLNHPQTDDISKVICKITGVNAQGQPNHIAIGECFQTYGVFSNVQEYPFSQDQHCTPVEAYPGSLLIDNVGDVRIVILGENPTYPQD